MTKLSREFEKSRLGKARWIHLGVLALAAVLVQVALHHTYLPWWCGDSEGYSSQASILYGSDFTKDPGERTPGYPLFLLGCEMLAPCRVSYLLMPQSAQFITWIQSILSVASVALLYLSMERLQIRAPVRFALSLVFALLVGVQEFAMELMPENVCLFAVVLATYLVTLWMERWRRGLPARGLALLSGLAFGAAIMVRPNMMPLWMAVVAAIPALMLWRWVRRQPFPARGAIAQITRPLFASGALVVVVWLFIHYENTGFVTLSGIGGLARTSAAYNLFDHVHPKDKVLGEIMVKYYHENNWDGHTDRQYGWYALGEIQGRSDEMPIANMAGRAEATDGAVFHYLEVVSNGLLWEHPGVWAENSLSDLESTLDFHFTQASPGVSNFPVTFAKKSLTHEPVIAGVRGWEVLRWIAGKESALILLLYLLTFVALGISAVKTLAAPDLRSGMLPITVFALSLGTLLCMVAPSIIATYDNRYSVPLVPLFALCSAYVVELGLKFFSLDVSSSSKFPAV